MTLNKMKTMIMFANGLKISGSPLITASGTICLHQLDILRKRNHSQRVMIHIKRSVENRPIELIFGFGLQVI